MDEEVVDKYGRIGLYEFDKENNSLKEVKALGRSLSSNEISINTKLTNKYKEYVILMADKWEEAWNKEILDPNTKFSEMDIALTIDSSGSMDDNDPNNLRKSASINFINKLEGNNRAAIVDFDSWAVIRQALTTDKSILITAINQIDSNGGTNISYGLAKAINALDINSRSILTEKRADELIKSNSLEEQGTSLNNINDDIDTKSRIANNSEDVNRDKYIMLLTDGQSYISEEDSSLVYARENGIKIFTIGLGSGVEEDTLRMISSTTGGKYLFATSANDLEGLFDEITTQTIDLYTDSDNDGIPNYFERNLRLNNGTILQLDPNNPDTDGDGLSDGFEICGVNNDRDSFFSKYDSIEKYFNYLSRPDLKDTDKDNILDTEDEEVNNFNILQKTYLEVSDLSYIEGTIKKGTIVKDIEYNFKSDYVTSETCGVNNWRVVKHNNGGNSFGAIALIKGNKLIVGYTGTEMTSIPDWTANLSMLFKSNSQNNNAQKFIDSVLKKYNYIEEVYITGHSLGGHLAQYTTNYIYNKDKYKVKASTFNAAPFTHPKHINGKSSIALINKEKRIYLGYVITHPLKDGIIDEVIEYTEKNGPFIEYKDTIWNDYDNIELDNIITNHVIINDALNFLMGGRYIGEDIRLYDSKYTTKEVFKAHALKNFYGHKIEK